MIATQTASAVVGQRCLRPALPRPAISARRNVMVHFRENKRPASAADVDSMEEKLHTGKETDTKLSPEEIDSVSYAPCIWQLYCTFWSAHSLTLVSCLL